MISPTLTPNKDDYIRYLTSANSSVYPSHASRQSTFAHHILLFYLGKMTLTENSCAISLLKTLHISPLMLKLRMTLFYLLTQS